MQSRFKSHGKCFASYFSSLYNEERNNNKITRTFLVLFAE